MNPILPALLVALAVLIAGVWLALAYARLRSYRAGRRDVVAGRVDDYRKYVDRAYFDGVLAQWIADNREDSAQ